MRPAMRAFGVGEGLKDLGRDHLAAATLRATWASQCWLSRSGGCDGGPSSLVFRHCIGTAQMPRSTTLFCSSCLLKLIARRGCVELDDVAYFLEISALFRVRRLERNGRIVV